MISQEAQRVLKILGRDVDEDMRHDSDVMQRPAVVLARDVMRLEKELQEALRRGPGPLLQKRVEDLELEVRCVRQQFLGFGHEHEVNLKTFSTINQSIGHLCQRVELIEAKE